MDDDVAGRGLDHLQKAALEMIEAARAFLDIAEEFVADRERMAEAASAFGTFAAAAARAATSDHEETRETRDTPDEDQVERITLS